MLSSLIFVVALCPIFCKSSDRAFWRVQKDARTIRQGGRERRWDQRIHYGTDEAGNWILRRRRWIWTCGKHVLVLGELLVHPIRCQCKRWCKHCRNPSRCPKDHRLCCRVEDERRWSWRAVWWRCTMIICKWRLQYLSCSCPWILVLETFLENDFSRPLKTSQ